MLYERWMQTAQSRRSEIALWELGTGRFWTFGQLADASWPEPAETVVYPSGRGAEFVMQVLAGWQHHRLVCPVEPGAPPPTVPDHLPSADIVHCKSTSATTGPSRLIAFSAEQLQADVDQIVATMGLRPDWPNLGVISLAHSYGFSNLVLPLLLHGIPLLLVDSPLPEAVRAAAATVPDLVLPAVPAMWRAWHEAASIPPNTRLAITAGAPMPVSLEAAIYDKSGLKVHNFYGASECGGIAYDRSETPRREAADVGSALAGVALARGGDGCLEVRGAAVGWGYWPEPDEALAAGCFRTSDLVDLLGGSVFIRGRVSDLINVAGRKLSPEFIEQALLQHPSVSDCLAFGVPSRDAERGDDIVVWVAVDEAVSNRELRGFLLERLPSWQVPREWCRASSLEVNERGKRSRAEWKLRYLDMVERGEWKPSAP